MLTYICCEKAANWEKQGAREHLAGEKCADDRRKSAAFEVFQHPTAAPVTRCPSLLIMQRCMATSSGALLRASSRNASSSLSGTYRQMSASVKATQEEGSNQKGMQTATLSTTMLLELRLVSRCSCQRAIDANEATICLAKRNPQQPTHRAQASPGTCPSTRRIQAIRFRRLARAIRR